MNKYAILISMWMMLFVAETSIASDSLNCGAVFGSGIFNRSSTSDFRLSTENVNNSVCSDSNKAESGYLDISYTDALDASGGYSKEESDSYCNNHSRKSTHWSDSAAYIEKASSILTKAWTKCLSLKSSSYFVHHYVTPLDKRAEQFQYRIRLNRPSGVTVNSTISSWTPLNAKCERNGKQVSSLDGLVITPNGVEFICSRDPNNSTSLSIEVSEGGQDLNSVIIPALPVDPCSNGDARRQGFTPSCMLASFGPPNDLNICGGHNVSESVFKNTCSTEMTVILFENTTQGAVENSLILNPREEETMTTCRPTAQRAWVSIPFGCNIRRPQAVYTDTGGTHLR